MTNEEGIFEAAAALPGEDRAAFLDSACAGQSETRAWVEALLRSHDARGSMEDDTLVLPRARADQPGDRVGRYKLLGQIGEGGFGVVWVAEQVEPVHRLVALKIIKAGMDTRAVIARFEAERQALAMMDHPHIARVLEAGETTQGRPFFVMELVKGVPITEFCDTRRLSTRQRLELFADVCAAINHAHQKGVIHRDIKPSNVMVALDGEKPTPKVIDFGIAKATQGRLTDRTLFTRLDEFIGTPAYMSPEQAALSGLDVDTRSDIYALGILLYELLTGKPPFEARVLVSAGYDEMRRIIREVEPSRPSSRLSTMAGKERIAAAQARNVEPAKLSRLIEPDLDWIVMKAIEKDRTRRYETANGLALDIRRFLEDEPVSAGPPSARYRFRKFARRNKVILRAIVTTAAVLIAATIISTWQAVRAGIKHREAIAQTQRAERGEATARSATERLKQQLGEAAQSDRVTAHHLAGQGRFRDALARLARACEYAPESSAAAEQAVFLGNTAEFHPPVATLLSGATAVTAHYSPDGDRILTASADNIMRVWDAGTNRLITALTGHTERVRSAQFSPDGGRIVSASDDHTARVWDARTGQPRVLRGHTAAVQSAHFSRDGARLATASADGTALVWDASTQVVVATLSGHRADVNTAEFNAEGTRIVTASDDDTARVWEAATGRLIATLSGHEVGEDTVVTLPRNEADVNTAHFSPDGTRVLTSSNDNTARVWDAASGRHMLTLRGHQDRLRDAEFSPDGTLIVTNSEDKTARVWNAATAQPVHILSGHLERLRSAHFNADGQSIVTASDDRTARVWETTSGRLIATLAGHQQRVWTGQFSPDGSRIVTGSDDGSACVWDLTSSRPMLTLPGPRHRVWSGRFSADGSHVVTASLDRIAHEWEVPGGQSPGTPFRVQDPVWSAVFSPDSARLITASDGLAARVWDAATGGHVATLSSPGEGAASRQQSARVWEVSSGRLIATLTGGGVDVHHAQFSPSGQQVATASNDNTGRIWNVSTGQVSATLSGHRLRLRAVEFSPNGERIVTTSDDLTARTWDVRSGSLIHTLSGHGDTLRSVRFSPGGAQIVTASDDKTARVWEAATGQLTHTLSGHLLRVRGAEFSPKGDRIITSSDDKTARIWSTKNGQPIKILTGHAGRIRDAQFAPDGQRVVTASDDHTARVWEADSGQLIATLFDHGDRVCGVRFSPDGTRLATSSEDGTARVWESLGTTEPPPPWFSEFLRVIAAGIMNTDGELGELAPTARVEQREKVLAAVADEGSRYGAFARYHLTPGPDKPARPGAKATCRDAADSLISADATRWQIERAYALDPAHPLVQIALARFAATEVQAEFLRSYGLDRLAPNAPVPTLRRAAALLAAQPGQEAKASMLLGRLPPSH